MQMLDILKILYTQKYYSHNTFFYFLIPSFINLVFFFSSYSNIL